MERRSMVAIAVLFLMWVFYPTYLRMITPKQPAILKNTEVLPAASKEILGTAAPGVIQEEVSAKVAEPIEMEIETGTLRATFSNIGGGVRRLVSFMERNGHRDEIILFDVPPAEPSAFAMLIPGLPLDLERAPHQGPSFMPDGEGVEFSYTLPSGLVISKKFKVGEAESTLRLNIEVKNPTSQAKPFFFELGSVLQKTEESIKTKPARMQSLASYTKIGNEIRRAAFMKLKKKGEYQEGQIFWTALGRLYFAVFVKPEEGTHVDSFRASADNIMLRGATRVAAKEIPPGGSESYSFLIYAGPTKRSTLISFGAEFEAILASGIWGIFKTVVLILLGFFYKLFHNYGIAIITVAVSTRMLFWPLTHKSFESMQKLQILQPKMKALQEQHKNSPEKLQKEMMEFYKRHKVNPFGGCLPLLIQIPMFFALSQVLSQAVELRGAHFFGWITDLSEPDVLFKLPFTLPIFGNAIRLMPILYIISTVVQQRLQPAASSGTSSEQEKMMKLMPIFIGFIFYNMPSGLSLYFLVSNLLMIQSQLVLKRKFAKTSLEESAS